MNYKDVGLMFTLASYTVNDIILKFTKAPAMKMLTVKLTVAIN